jgi:aspartyl-tRNA(Asn)/glutamyl-tRNA(Gln) amidotransferase subunit C
MDPIGREDVDALARLARLDLADEEVVRLQADLRAILGYASRLAAIPIDGREPMTHAVPFPCPLRDDAVAPSLAPAQALAAAPRTAEGCFVVPRVVAGETP